MTPRSAPWRLVLAVALLGLGYLSSLPVLVFSFGLAGTHECEPFGCDRLRAVYDPAFRAWREYRTISGDRMPVLAQINRLGWEVHCRVRVLDLDAHAVQAGSCMPHWTCSP